MLGPDGGEVADRLIVLEQAGLEVDAEHAQLVLGGSPGPAPPPPVPRGEAVPGVGEADEVRPTPVAMGGEHRADPVPGGVGADDDVVGGDAREHRLAGVPG